MVEADLPVGVRDGLLIVGLMFRGIRELVGEMERPQRLERRTRAMARPGRLISDGTVERLLQAERRLAERVGRLFADHDVLLTPMMSEPAVPAGIMEGRGALATYLWSTTWVPFNVLWNSTGQPAASVPAGFSADRPPAGRPDRRPAARRGDPPVARRAARGGAPVGRPPPAGARKLTAPVLDSPPRRRHDCCQGQLIGGRGT